MKSLYTYLLNEAQGLLGDKFKYDALIDEIIDIFLEKQLNVRDIMQKSDHTHIFSQRDMKRLEKHYPSWLAELNIELIPNSKSDRKTKGVYHLATSTYENGKLSCKIGIDLNIILFAIYNFVTINVNGNSVRMVGGIPEDFRAMCTKTLQHELKHAFDDWIIKTKNISRSKSDNYQGVWDEIQKTRASDMWATLLSKIAYLLSPAEMSAFQQEYLKFYREHPIGQLYIEILKNKFGTQTNLFKFLSNIPFGDYDSKFFDPICQTGLMVNNKLDECGIDVFFENQYLKVFSLLNNYIDSVKDMTDFECTHICKACEISYRCVCGKTINAPNDRMKLELMLREFKNRIYLYISKRIFDRVF